VGGEGNITHGARKGNNGVDGLVDSIGWQATRSQRTWSVQVQVGLGKTPAGYGTHFKPGISPWKRINSILFHRLRRVWRAWEPFFRLTVPECVQFLARYRPLSSFRSQHQDATISDEQGRRAAETRRHVGWH